MHESDAYYEETLYPLQNGVLSTLAACEAPFYLTGGTALHRHYFGYRYSDDLDLFVNQDAGFDGYTWIVRLPRFVNEAIGSMATRSCAPTNMPGC